MSASQVGHQEQRARGEHGFGGREEVSNAKDSAWFLCQVNKSDHP